MTIDISRRSLLALGTFGLGAAAVPGHAALARARGFTHNVASGEPSASSVMLWTRYVPPRGEGRLRFELAETADFSRPVAGGTAIARPERDWCVKPVATGLAPGRWYYYRFLNAAGRPSPVGRTRTLPDGPTDRFTLGVFSCSNLPFGWFNAYAHAAGRTDIDLMVHLGDYLYEYPRGRYPNERQALAGRRIDPDGEIIQLADYRLRWASYRADPALQRLHQLFPMIAMWDDHESANDSWRDGADNHQPEEGDWQLRKRIAARVYREWMPVGDGDWTSYRVGDLADIFRPETRLTGRDRPLDIADVVAGAIRDKRPLPQALAAFRDGAWSDPRRSILGQAQEQWLTSGLAASTRAGVKWQVLAQQVIMGQIAYAPKIAQWIPPSADPQVLQRTQIGVAASAAGLPFNFDQWDGYPAARQRILAAARQADANLVVLSGDSHNAWAFELPLGHEPAGIEFAGQSVTSPGFERALPQARPVDLVAAVQERNGQLKWADFSRRGYLTVTFTPAAATGEWVFLDTIRQRSTALSGTHRMTSRRGSNRFA